MDFALKNKAYFPLKKVVSFVSDSILGEIKHEIIKSIVDVSDLPF